MVGLVKTMVTRYPLNPNPSLEKADLG